MSTPSGQRTPSITAPLPGSRSRAYVERLAASECPAFTTRRARRSERAGAPFDPIVWSEARGANVVDADGNVFVDLTSGFGVAAVGHAHPRVVAAVHAQSDRLLHALGDLHPSDVKVDLLARLAELAPFDDARVVLSLNGADAIETALKTAVLASGRPSILAFEGGYHGLSHGPLAACGYGAAFRAPFAEQLNPHVTFAPFPDADRVDAAQALEALDAAWPKNPLGAVLIEPMLGRGGVIVPPPGFLAGLAERCRAHGAVLIADEIFTGLGRTGDWFRSVAEDVVPDVICIGKALGGGLPVSACLGRAEVMAAWGDPDGMALHTGTFFGHPLGCAAAMATLDVIRDEALPDRAREIGTTLRKRLDALDARPIRSLGLVAGVDVGSPDRGLRAVHELLQLGYLVTPAGAGGVVQIAPPLTIDVALLEAFVDAFDGVLRRLG